MYKKCKKCGKKLIGDQRKYCSRKCAGTANTITK